LKIAVGEASTTMLLSRRNHTKCITKALNTGHPIFIAPGILKTTMQNSSGSLSYYVVSFKKYTIEGANYPMANQTQLINEMTFNIFTKPRS
jgi:hypothetical protein